MPAAIVFAAAPLQPTRRLVARLAELQTPFVVAADGGATSALQFGFRPDVVVGDFDSLEASTLTELQDVAIERYPRDKDFTDGELAIQRAISVDPDELFLVGFLGGPRLDQSLVNLLSLTRIGVTATLLDELNECRLVRPGASYAWRSEPTEIVSLIALSEAATVSTRGLRWPLTRERLMLGQTRGVSNEPTSAQAMVAVHEGLLVVTRHFAAL